jgi:hypothetical protein
MKQYLTVVISVGLVLASTVAIAGSGSDACRQEEQRLRAEEAERCSSVGYVFNPSACFNARKALLPYTKGKCRNLAAAEGGAELMAPVAAAPAPSPAPAPPARVAPAVDAVPTTPPAPRVTTGQSTAAQSELELLKGEIAELRAEMKRLQEEISRLRGRSDR